MYDDASMLLLPLQGGAKVIHQLLVADNFRWNKARMTVSTIGRGDVQSIDPYNIYLDER